MTPEKLLEQNQILSSLSLVLLHDLRNPLHGATLLVEAMGLKPDDPSALRARLSAQLVKLETILSLAAGPLRDLAVAAQIETTPMGDILARVARMADSYAEAFAASLVIEGDGTLEARVDPLAIARAIVEAALFMHQQIARQTPNDAPRVCVRAEAEDPSTLRVTVDGLSGSLPSSVAKTPFVIGDGGVSAALARALAQLSGATLRLVDGTGAAPRLVFGLPRAEPSAR
jgi:hypothetical protein